MSYIYKQRIGDAWSEALGNNTWDVLNPATEETVVTVPFGDGRDCRAAIDAAYAAFPSWSGRTAYERAAILQRTAALIRERAEELARTNGARKWQALCAGARRVAGGGRSFRMVC